MRGSSAFASALEAAAMYTVLYFTAMIGACGLLAYLGPTRAR